MSEAPKPRRTVSRGESAQLRLKEAVRAHVASSSERLCALSHRIHANPEVGFEEEQAASWVAEELDAGGFTVEVGPYDLPTAVLATAGSGPLRIVVCAEYDALPGLGHACGHNVIAATSVGAGMALAPLADELGMTVVVLGTPAEEVGNGGGKILLLERGAFSGAHAAMMVHPTPFEVAAPPLIAASQIGVRFTGRESHAGAAPENGINAADAMTVGQVAIGLLRQHILSTDRIHGIVTHGGDAPNVIPARTTARYMVRAETMERLTVLRERVCACFEAGAVATGCAVEISGGDRPYAEVVHDEELAQLYKSNAQHLGRVFPELGPILERFTPSTDMGNVSQVIPSIHPYISIDSGTAVNHQPAFAEHAVSKAADRAIVDGAVALAWTAVDIGAEDGIRERLLTQSARDRE